MNLSFEEMNATSVLQHMVSNKRDTLDPVEANAIETILAALCAEQPEEISKWDDLQRLGVGRNPQPDPLTDACENCQNGRDCSRWDCASVARMAQPAVSREQIAKALFSSEYPKSDFDDNIFEPVRGMCYSMADAVLALLERKP